MTRTPLRRPLVALSGALMAVAAVPAPADAQIAAAAVNGVIVYTVAAKDGAKRDAKATGVAAAAAKVFNPVQDDYRVSVAPGGAAGNKAANANQKADLQTLLADAKAISAAAGKGAEAVKSASANLFDDIGGASISGHFPTIAKVAGAGAGPLAQTNLLQNAAAVESAQGVANQTLTPVNNDPNPPLSYKPVVSGDARVAKGTAPMPMAVSVGFNLDPLGVEWAGEATTRIDFAGSLLTAETVGVTSAAAASLAGRALYRNGTTDIDQPVDGASPLFAFSLAAFSADGRPAGYVLGLESFGNPIADSVGNVGLTAVAAELESRLVVTPTTIQLPTNYSITVGIPGTPSQSVLYYQDAGATAAVVAVPAPGSLLLAVGGAGVLLIRRARGSNPDNLRVCNRDTVSRPGTT